MTQVPALLSPAGLSLGDQLLDVITTLLHTMAHSLSSPQHAGELVLARDGVFVESVAQAICFRLKPHYRRTALGLVDVLTSERMAAHLAQAPFTLVKRAGELVLVTPIAAPSATVASDHVKAVPWRIPAAGPEDC